MDAQSLGDFSVVRYELEALEESIEEYTKKNIALQQQAAELLEEEMNSSMQMPTLFTSIGLLESTISDYKAVLETYKECLTDNGALLGKEVGRTLLS
jgi:hypothetical protein